MRVHMSKALVTGANGHIGANLVRELLEHGYEVVALVRKGADLRGLDGVAVTTSVGDVCDGAAVRRAVEGCRHVFHLAAPYATWSPRPEEIIEPAVEGTKTVLREGRAAGVSRVVLTGSCNAVGFSRGEPLDETKWREHAASPYMRAKLEQERCAASLARELDLDVVTVLPTAVLGPHDYRKTPTTAPFVDALLGRGAIPFSMNVVDVRDVARGHRLAAERGRRGERYLLGGDNVDVTTLAQLVERHTGKKPATSLPPEWVLRAVATLSEAVSRISKRPPVITRALLDDVAGGAPVFVIDKARHELGYESRSADDVVAATVEWARRMKWLA
jgi:dihydroflavonol-4-reductase